MSDSTYSLDDLAERSDTPARTIRYYIQRGLVSRPVGEKRGAHYTALHLQQLLQIRRWVGAGMSLQRIATLMQGEPAAEAASSLTASGHYPEAPEEIIYCNEARAPANRKAFPAAPGLASREAFTTAPGLASREAFTTAPGLANREAIKNAEDGEHTLTVKHHHPVAPGIEVVIDPARRPLTSAQAESLLAVIREHLARLEAGESG